MVKAAAVKKLLHRRYINEANGTIIHSLPLIAERCKKNYREVNYSVTKRVHSREQLVKRSEALNLQTKALYFSMKYPISLTISKLLYFVLYRKEKCGVWVAIQIFLWM